MKVEYRDSCAVVTLPEKVAIFMGVEEFKETLINLYDEGYHIIVLDFSNLIMIDTSGLSQLLVFQHRLREREGELRIVNITSNYIREMFETIELFKVIPIEGMKKEGERE